MEFAWGTEAIDIDLKDLPSLKAAFIISQLPDSGCVIDVGCGGGKLLKTISSYRKSLMLGGCDIRPLAQPGPAFEFRLCGTEPRAALPYPDAYADTVLLVDVLEHVRDPEFLLGEIRRILKLNGKLIAFVPAEGGRFSAYRFFRFLLGQDLYVTTKDHIQTFSLADLDRLVSRDFVVCAREYAYHLVGQWMDATFFAATRIPWLARKFWQENQMYVGERANRPVASIIFNAVLRFANRVAWAESRLLRRSTFGAAGVLVAATPRT